jgi:sulfur-oxidizing protein SoxA
MRGEEYWTSPGGPKGVSLEKCDLGLGPGVIAGAYAQLPRYFADTGKVMDAEMRVIHCMVTLQGHDPAALSKKPFDDGNVTPDATNVVTWIAEQSRGRTIAVPQQHPQEQRAYALGREVFNYRAGPYDFGCVTCHGVDGMRIRTQDLPNLTKPEEALRAFQGWPGYRMTGGRMLTLQWRMTDCFRQQRFPEPGYVSDTIAALLTYLGANANGQVYNGPGIKR